MVASVVMCSVFCFTVVERSHVLWDVLSGKQKIKIVTKLKFLQYTKY